MISWTDINSLNKKKLNLELQLNDLLKTEDVSNDKVNELKAEILYLNKQISKILGSKEIERLEELKGKRKGLEQRRIKSYYELKDKYKKISKMRIARKRMINILDSKQDIIEDSFTEERIKVKN